MRYLGIDYGKKRVGVALSDEAGQFAMVYDVLPNTHNLVHEIAAICQNEKVGAVILGESLDFKNKPNPIMEQIKEFKAELEKNFNLPVYLEPEFLTSAEAERIQGKTAHHDASAAALILKSYLERKSHRDASEKSAQ